MTLLKHARMVHQLVGERLAKPVELFKLQPHTSLWQNPRLVQPIARAMLATPPGVHVLHAGPGMGKSTALCTVLHELQYKGRVRGGIVWNGGHLPTTRRGEPVALKLGAWAKNEFQLPQEAYGDTLVDLLPPLDESGRRAIICIDQFDHYASVAQPIELESLVTHLAETAQLSDAFTAVLVVRDAATAKQVLDFNGGQKIGSVLDEDEPFEWTDEELGHVVDRLHEHNVLQFGSSDGRAHDAVQEACHSVGGLLTALQRYRAFD